MCLKQKSQKMEGPIIYWWREAGYLGCFLSTSVKIVLPSHNQILFLLPFLSPHTQSEDAAAYRVARQRLWACPRRPTRCLCLISDRKQETFLTQGKAQNIFFWGATWFWKHLNQLVPPFVLWLSKCQHSGPALQWWLCAGGTAVFRGRLVAQGTGDTGEKYPKT